MKLKFIHFKKFKKIKLFSIILPIVILSVVIFLYSNPTSKYNPISKYSIYIKNGKVTYLNPTSETFSSDYIPKLNFADTKISNVDGIKLKILNNNVISDIPTLFKAQRYYFPLEKICKVLNYNISKSNDIYTLTKDENTIYVSENSFTENSVVKQLRGDLINSNNTDYISVSDIENIFNLFATFDSNANTITLSDNSISNPDNINIPQSSDKIAFFRFEDFTCGDTNLNTDNQTKVKCMVSLLYKNGIKFHTGWIPRFKAPQNNIDNDLLTNENMVNAGFINILDYMINKGGEIGLHGYTHQHDDERSAVGEDLDDKTNNNEEGTRFVIESGLDTASALNIPITFFESPHYKDTELQKDIINEYFKYVYEPYDNNKTNLYSPNNKNIYIPTPLGYVPDPDDISSIENGLKANNPTKLNSFFYHPSVELNFVNYKIKDGTLKYHFDDNSPLQKIVKLLRDNNYVTIHVTDIN